MCDCHYVLGALLSHWQIESIITPPNLFLLIWSVFSHTCCSFSIHRIYSPSLSCVLPHKSRQVTAYITLDLLNFKKRARETEREREPVAASKVSLQVKTKETKKKNNKCEEDWQKLNGARMLQRSAINTSKYLICTFIATAHHSSIHVE